MVRYQITAYRDQFEGHAIDTSHQAIEIGKRDQGLQIGGKGQGTNHGLGLDVMQDIPTLEKVTPAQDIQHKELVQAISKHGPNTIA